MSGEYAFYMRAKGLIPKVDEWRDWGEKVCYWALCSLENPGASAYNDQAYRLVHRCFKVGDRVMKLKIRANILQVKGVLAQVGAFFAEAKDSKDYITIGPKIRPDDIAYAEVGGWKNGDKKGLTFVLNECVPKSDEALMDIIMHESVHFAGNIGHYDLNGSPAYGDKVFLLNADQALQNASSYAYLAYLARMDNTKWLTAT